MTTIPRFAIAALMLLTSAPLSAQEKDKPSPPPAQPQATRAPAPPQIPVRIQLVLSRFQGEKKLSSVPYVLFVTTHEQRTSLRMGVKLPVASGGNPLGAYTYQDVGTNIDCQVATGTDNNYKVTVTVNDSSVYSPDRVRSDADRGRADAQLPAAPTESAPPVLRSFTSNFTILLRDGQTVQYTTATDQVSGEVLKIDATLNVLK